MESSTSLPGDDEGDQVHKRGVGRGRNFMVLHRPVWSQLCTAPCSNRFNFVTAFLVLLAGTGSDHRLTKWSAKACEEHAGMGKPRARQAIEELTEAGLVERTEASTTMMPQYRLPPIPRDAEPIYLPTQFVTGLAEETPMLRRLREAGDFEALRMLIDLYGLLETDATQGVPISFIHTAAEDNAPARKVCEFGVNAVWAMPLPSVTTVSGDWMKPHKVSSAKPWANLWERLRLLEAIGAIWFEPWVFSGSSDHAEPLMPVDPSVLYSMAEGDEVAQLTRLMQDACRHYVEMGEREYLLDRYGNDILIPLPLHHQAPALRGVMRVKVEADTPGFRRAYGARMRVIERVTPALQQLIQNIGNGSHTQPVRYAG